MRISSRELPCVAELQFARCVAFALLLHGVVNSSADDWPMRGRTIYRTSSVEMANGPLVWDVKYGGLVDKGRNVSKAQQGQVKWSAGGFSQSMCDPVIANGLIWIGTADPVGDSSQDSSVLACFDEKTGELLYQHISEKLGNSRQDWPWTGNTSSPFVQGNRLWFCSNQLEVICLNTGPLIDRTGDPIQEWSVDLNGRFNVVPTDLHLGNRATRCSIVGVDGRIFVNTTNSFNFGATPEVDPVAPSFVCLDQETGTTIWMDNSPGADIARNQHCNPVIFRFGNRNYVAIGQGDGFVRAFECETGKVVWKFDLNTKQERSEIKNATIAYTKTRLLTESPVFDGRYLYFVIGTDREASFGRGGVYCIDPFASGDISSEIVTNGEPVANPNSKLVWQSPEAEGKAIQPSIAGLCVTEKSLFAADIDGFVRCLDKSTGTQRWLHDAHSNVIGTPLVVGDTLYIASEDGDVTVLSATAGYEHIATMHHESPFESSPVYANDTLFLLTRRRLYAVGKLP